LAKEIHAHKFVAGNGHVSSRVVAKWERSRIFLGLLRLVASLPLVLVFNVCLPKRGLADPEMTAWDRLLNRLERTMLELDNRELGTRHELVGAAAAAGMSAQHLDSLRDRLLLYQSRAFIVADEGKAHQITRALRRKHHHNPIPSSRGGWPGGQPTRNITIERIIEDPVFKPSDRSYFIQLADCISFALLKRETSPTPRVLKYGLNAMFEDALRGVCYRPACRNDPLGIVRN
jgi:hypothetical protein